MDPVLHIGYPKTATTWLQKSVLRRHPQLAVFTRKHALWFEALISRHPLAFDATELRKQFESLEVQAEGRLPFLSHESWAGDPYSGGRDQVENARRLHAVWPRARVVIVVREPVSLMESIYKQYVQEGGALAPAAWLAARYPDRDWFDPHYLAFDQVLDLYGELFGRERICALPYERIAKRPQAFLEALLSFCGVDPMREAKLKKKRRNRGLSAPGLAVARAGNRWLGSRFNTAPLVPRGFLEARDLRRLLQRRIDPWLRRFREDDAPLFGEEATQRLHDHFRPGLQRLEREWGIDFEAERAAETEG